MMDYSIEQIQGEVLEGNLTYERLTQYYLNQIALYNSKVNAVSELNPKALEKAIELDQERKKTGLRSMLHGIPIMIKDNINFVGEGIHTTAGSIVLKDHMAQYDATIVTKLMEAGANIIGKTNLSEFANFISETSPNGYSALKGQVINPYGNFDVGGSSSGSAVAVACGFCQGAIGTETSGSIISPASCNSVIGLKPSVGVVSRYGIIPIAATQDVPGPIARHLSDVALIQGIIEGHDPLDTSTQPDDFFKDRDIKRYQKALVHKDIRLGVFRPTEDQYENRYDYKIFDKAVAMLKDRGIQLKAVSFDSKKYVVNWDVLYYEFPRDLETYLKTIESEIGVSKLEDFIAIHQLETDIYIPYGQGIFETAIEKQPLFNVEYDNALNESMRYGQIIKEWLVTNQLSAVCYMNCDAIDIAARIGLPSITFPIGYTDDGKPVGFTITTDLYEEEKLLNLAYRLMPLIGKHRPAEMDK